MSGPLHRTDYIQRVHASRRPQDVGQLAARDNNEPVRAFIRRTRRTDPAEYRGRCQGQGGRDSGRAQRHIGTLPAELTVRSMAVCKASSRGNLELGSCPVPMFPCSIRFPFV